MINDALRQYFHIFVIVYLNDILIFFKTYKEHVKHVCKTLKCLNKRDLLFKSKKCELHKSEIKFLNFIVESIKIKMNLKKFATIKN